MKKLTQEEFIKRAKEIHGDKYDYSKSIYTGRHKKLEIICKSHGSFIQYAKDHIGKQKSGCPKCVGKNLTIAEVIKKFNIVHNFKYDYSNSEFKKFSDKIDIICPYNHLFKQTVSSHLNGYGCPKCKFIKTSEIKTMPLQVFIEKSNIVHNNKYDYSKCNIRNNKKQVCIICPKHGEFWQKKSIHLKGHGCKYCSHDNLSLQKIVPTEEYIKKAKKKHGNKYDYSKTIVQQRTTKIKVICRKHGEFLTCKSAHLKGVGCKKCANEYNTGTYKFTEWFRQAEKSKNFDGFKVYLIKCWNNEEEFYKVGRTYTSLKKRFSTKKLLPYEYEIIALYVKNKLSKKEAKIIYNMENTIKRKWKNKKYMPLLNFGGKQECYKLSLKDVENISNMLKNRIVNI